MEAELAALASAGATTLVGLMVSDSWTQVKEGFARLFARGGATDSSLRYLETSRAGLLAAQTRSDAMEAAVIEAEWQTRLYQLLQSTPTVAEDLRRLVLHFPEPRPMGPVYNVNSGAVRFGSVIQAGQVSGTAFQVMSTSEEHMSERENEK